MPLTDLPRLVVPLLLAYRVGTDPCLRIALSIHKSKVFSLPTQDNRSNLGDIGTLVHTR